MPFVPVFQIGVWNAWIFVLYSWVIVLLLPVVNKSTGETGNITMSSVYSKREMILAYSYHIIAFFCQ